MKCEKKISFFLLVLLLNNLRSCIKILHYDTAPNIIC